MIHTRYLIRELRHAVFQSITFVLCVSLSIATLVALNSFKRDVRHSMLDDAKALHGGDVIVHSHYPISEKLNQAVTALEKDGMIEQTRIYGFYSVIRADRNENTLLADIKAVGPNYPWYGTIKLRSGRAFQQVLQPGRVLVATEVLQRLGVSVGTRLQIGEAVVEIAGVIEFDPSQPISLFSLGPRIYASSTDLARFNVLDTGSRSHYEIALKVKDKASTTEIAADLSRIAITGQERVSTADTARSRIKRFFDNLLFFLSFISIFTLLLSGIGMQSSLAAIVRRKEKTIAVTKAVGAGFRFQLLHYLLIVLTLGFFGCLGGIGAGYAIKYALPLLFQGIVPATTTFTVDPTDIGQGLALGLSVVLLFTFLPLYRLSSIKPVAVFRRDSTEAEGSKAVYVISLLTILLVSILVVDQLEDIRNGIYFMLGCLGLIALIFLLTIALLAWLRTVKTSSPAWRLALRSLERPGNATRSIIITLASALTALLTIYQLQFNLFASFVSSYPAEAPNLFCLDIQPDQRQRFREIVGRDVEFFPVIRARLLSINGELIDYERERARKSDNLAREFNLTYRDHVLDNERIDTDAPLFAENRTPKGIVEVSVLDTIADIGNIDRGDRLVFSVQGVLIDAEVTTIRSRTQSMLFPFFYFVFPEEVLEEAPQTLFTALHFDRDAIPAMIKRIVTELPNVSTINAADTAVRLGEMIKRLSVIITFFALFSILAGALIMISAIFATRLERIEESVYYKVLGAKSAFVLAILVYENTVFALISSLIAIVCANCGAWLLCRFYFDISYRLSLGAPVVMTVLVVGMVVALGVLGSLAVIREKPASYLRLQNEG